jgi:hypothetical protein
VRALLSLGWLEAEGSTRAVGLLRVLLVLIAWARWGEELLPYHDLSGSRLLLSLAFYATTAWMLVGWYGRLATASAAGVLLLLVYGWGRQGGVEDWAHHHTTVLANAAAFLALTPNSASFSVDRWLSVRRARALGLPPPPERGPLWAMNLVALQVSTVYFWSAVDKTSWAFLSGARLEQIFVEVWWHSDWRAPALVHGLFAAASIAVVALEYLLPFGLWAPRVRGPLLVVGLAMHAVFYVLIPVSTFTVTMAAMYLAFLDPGDVHRFVDRWLGHDPDR